MSEVLLEMKGITKEFPGVRALEDVTVQFRKGEIHALVGENGAGKSTLMKILSGFYPYGTYDGDIVLDGKVQKFNRIRDSEHAGIAIIYQELALVKHMTIAENLFLGGELCKARGVIDWNETFHRTEKALKEVGLRVSPATRVLAFSAYEDRDSVDEMLAAGAAAYLVKGARMDEVINAILRVAR